MSVKTLWATIQAAITGIGAGIGAWLGGLDGLVYALIAFVIADYITGLLAAISERRVNSAVGFRRISRKILIFTLVGLAHLLDIHVLGTPGVLRVATIFFYLSNEGISLIENATRLGLPIPPPSAKPSMPSPPPRTPTNHPCTNPNTPPPPLQIRRTIDEKLEHPRGR